MAKGGKGKALKTAKGKKAKHDANTAAQQGTLEEQLEVAADSRQHLTATQQAVVGLSNLGNTCFFNSSVQLLLSCAPLQQMVLHKDHDITKGPLGYALQQASLHAVGTSSKGKAGGHSTYNPQSLLSAVCCHAPVFKGKQQHDAHELMRMLLDGLQSQELRYKDLSRRSVSKSKAAALPGTVHTNGLAQNGASNLSTTSSSSTSSESTPPPAASTDAAPHSNGVLARSTPSDASDAVSTASSVGDDAGGTAAAGDGLADLCQAYLAKREAAVTLDSLTDTSEAASEAGAAAAAAGSNAAPSEASSTGADGSLSSTSSSSAGDISTCSLPALQPPAAAATGEPAGAEEQGSSTQPLEVLPAAQAPPLQDTDELPGLDPNATGLVASTYQAVVAPTQAQATATATANGTATGCRVCGAVLQQQQQQGSAGGPLQRKSLLPPEPPKSAGSSSVETVFGGVLSSVITCTACGYCSISYEPFLDLSLPIPLGAGRPGESIVRKGSLLSRLASRTGAKKKAAAQAASADTSTDGSNTAGADAAAAAAAAAEAAANAEAAAAAAAAAQGKKLNHKEKRKLQLQATKAAKEAAKLARLAKKKQQQQEEQQEPSVSSKGDGQPLPPAAAEVGANQGLFEDIPPTNYYLAEQTSLRESLAGRELPPQQQHDDVVSSLLDEQQEQQQQGPSELSANAAAPGAADVEPGVQLSVCAGGSDEAGSSHSGWTDIGGGSSSPRTAAVGCWGGGWVEQPPQLAAAAPSSTSSSFVQPPPSSSSGFAPSSSDAGTAAAAGGGGSDGSSPKAQQQPTTGRSTLHRRFGSLGNLSALTSGAKGGLTSLFSGRHSRQGSKDKDGLDKLAAAAVNGAAGGSGQRPSSAGVTSPSTGRGGLKGFLSRATTPPPPRPSSALGVVSEAGEAAGRSGVAGRSSIPEEYPVDDQLHRRGEQQQQTQPQEQPGPQGGGQAVLYTPLGVMGGLAVSAAGPEAEQPAATAAGGGSGGGGGGAEGCVQGTGSTGGVQVPGRRLQRAFSDDAVVRLGSFQRSSSSSSGGGGSSSGGTGEQQHAAAAVTSPAAPAGVAGDGIEPNAAHALGSHEQLPSPDKGVQAAAGAAAAVNGYASNPFAAPSVQLQPELGQEHSVETLPQQQQQQQAAAVGAVVLPAEDPFAAAAVVAKGDALAVKHCLASFFVREDVSWECPKEKALWKDRRVSAGSGGPAAAASSSGGGHSAAAAAGGTDAAAAGDGVCASCRQQQQPQQGGVAIAAHPRLQQLLEGNEDDDGPVFKQVSFSEREPQIHLVPGSVEQRGTDLSAALAGRRPFCRALSAAGASLLLTAQFGEVFLEGAAAGRELRLGLRAAGEGGVANAAAAKVLPGVRELQLGDVRLPDVQALSLSGEDSAALLQHWAQLLLNCMADLVACEGGLTGLQDMVRGGLTLMPAGGQRAALRPGYLDADSLEGQWKVRGQLPGAARGQDEQQQQLQGYWEYPAGDAEEAEDAATAATAGSSKEASPGAVGLSTAASPGPAAAAADSLSPAGSMQQQGLQPQGIAAAAEKRESQELGGCEDMFAMDEEGGGGAGGGSEQQEQGPCSQLTQAWQGDVLSSGSSSNLAGRAARSGSSLGSRDGDDSSSSTGRGMSPFKKVPLSPSAPSAAAHSSSSNGGGGGIAHEAGLDVTAAEEADGSPMPQVSTAAASRPVDIVQPLQGSPPDSYSLTGRSPVVGSAGKSGGTPGSLRRSSLRRRSSSCSRTAHKAYRIYIPPQVLLLHLKRFQHDGRGRLNKLDTAVAFDFELDLSPFMAANAPAAPAATAGSSSTAGSGSSVQQQQQELMYDLVGLVVHMGTMRGGHYVAYVKRVHGTGEQQQEQPAAGSSTSSGSSRGRAQWYYVSDTSVRPVGVSEVAAAQAYMLLYVRRPAQPLDAAEQGPGGQ